LWWAMADQFMTRFPVIYRIDQKEKKNEIHQTPGLSCSWSIFSGMGIKQFSNRLQSNFICCFVRRFRIRDTKEMSVGEWTAAGGFVLAILAAVYSSMKIIIRSVMSELSSNSGSSMKDQISRIEARLDYLYTHLIDQKK